MDKDRTTEWIWIKDWTLEDGEAPRQVYFRKDIHLSAPVKGELKISADSRYKLYINESNMRSLFFILIHSKLLLLQK